MKPKHRRVSADWRIAWRQAFASLRVRLLRQTLTTLGIGAGSAYLAAALVIRSVEVAKPTVDAVTLARVDWQAAAAAALCLLGVSNSMFIAVTERFREIGTFKCLGATDGFIVAVFFFEGLFMGLLGSVFGATLGAGGSAFVLSWGGSELMASWVLSAVVLGSTAGTGLTLIAALTPAIVAARMPAVAALRTEI